MAKMFYLYLVSGTKYREYVYKTRIVSKQLFFIITLLMILSHFTPGM